MTAISPWEAAARRYERPTWSTPGELARAIDPTGQHCGIQTPALDLIDAALVDVDAGRCDRLIISLAPQEGKSTRVTKIGPLWMLHRNPERRVAIVSYASDLAQGFGGEIRSYITANQGEDDTLDLGMRIAPDNGAVSSWRLDGHRGGVRSIGLSGGLTGRPADILFIDDPISNREQANSERYRQRAKDFWTSTAGTRLAPGAPVVLILTRWHEDDLAGWLQQREDGHRWRVINIPAQADHDPAKGETDPLGRKPGEYMISARRNEHTGQARSPKEWEQVKVQAGSRDWAALYQGHPSPIEGDTFKRTWWQQYENPLHLERDDKTCIVTDYDDMLISWDLTFKDTKVSDFVVGQVWMLRGVDAYLLDQVRARMDFPATVTAVEKLARKWPQATLKIIEDKANGPAVIASLRKKVPGIVPEEPQGSKVARAAAVTPLVEAGNVHLPDPTIPGYAWVSDLIEEAAAFPNGQHDDQVDALTQGLNRLVLQSLLTSADQIFNETDLDDELADFVIDPLAS